MPLRGKNHSSDVVDESPYFTNLDELDAWAVNPPKKLTEVLKYPPNASSTCTSNTGRKLLLCHDYKGGYQELANPSTRWYTFNYWSYCDTFVYFSHNRVTVPPSGWVTAAHRQGVKMLGTLIFEGKQESDELELLRVITGPLPNSTVSVLSPQTGGSVALSPHYARVLADLAYQRGFDGYLLNFEVGLKDRILEARALASWITILQSELQTKIGPHAQTIWYDSVTYQGDVRYQEQIDSLDLPFFISSTGFFTDYRWQAGATFLGKLNPQDFGFVQTRGDIFVGIDMYGRHTWYEKGFGCSTAIKAIDAASSSLSVALFAPGWTWESQKFWDDWFDYDKELWVGPNQAVGETVPSNDGGPYTPICKYFKKNPPPNPATLAFYTSFCPGTGLNWYVNGAQVLKTTDGWTDLQKQTSLGDLLWPQPEMRWDVGGSDVWLAFMAEKSWNGGGCLGINFSTSAEESSGRLPIQSLLITLGQKYAVTLICNTADADDLMTIDPSLSVEPLSAPLTIAVTADDTHSEDPSLGWRKLSTTFLVQDLVSQSKQSNNTEVLVSVGLDVSYNGDPGFFFFLGQMTVVPVLPGALDGSTVVSSVLWADFSTTTTGTDSTLPTGVLTWDVASFFVPGTVNRLPILMDVTSFVVPTTVKSTDDMKPPWTLQDPAQWLPKFIYFNIYAQAFGSDGKIGGPESASFMGTTGLDGRGQRFFIDEMVWPDGILGASKARLHVQGVTDHGEVLMWDRCAYVDIKLGS